MAFLTRHSKVLHINGLVMTTIRSLHRMTSTNSSKHIQNIFSQCKYAPKNSRALNQRMFSGQHCSFHAGIMSRTRLFTDLKVHRVFLVRHMSKGKHPSDQRAKSMIIYISAVGIFMLGMSYAGVPLYRMFCQVAGLGGQATRGHDDGKIESMAAVKDRIIQVKFNADVASSMRWNFKPQQSEVKVIPGETALAFYTAKNPTDKPIIGISTYNVVPFEAGQYFNKIQCFCFEEQRLNPHEQVDMPVFFFIDPEYAEDPKLETVHTITLSYTFFEAKEGLQLPYPGYATS